MSAPMSLVDQWRRSCAATLRAGGTLEYVDTPIAEPCAACGHPLDCPGEAIRGSYGRMHVSCVDGGQYAARGGR